LKTIAVPSLGSAVLAKPKETYTVYKSALKSEGCSTAAEASKSLKEAKENWKKAGLSWEDRVNRVGVFNTNDKFKGECFVFGKKKNGCKFKKTVQVQNQPIDLEMNLKIKSPCVETNSNEFEHGCKAEHHYKGNFKFGASSYPFDLVAPHPPGDRASLFTLEAIEIYSDKTVSLAAFFFSWTFVSPREKVMVLQRIR